MCSCIKPRFSEKYSILVGVFKTPKQYFKTNNVARIIDVDPVENTSHRKLEHAIELRTIKDVKSTPRGSTCLSPFKRAFKGKLNQVLLNMTCMAPEISSFQSKLC